ncbi:lantibiotic immunity ABC transporter MutG family permease subunit [Aminipila sp.]|uniref:lantibiotic immunity ABC transporter MutG family permease subunit n=1 Tax=Aminipila sp. TaxID=2060095 RepID=UPI00289C6A77|nr:lantibiotic immunity ABC transporter MutG family permease subunit [Aminipila sp.]
MCFYNNLKSDLYKLCHSPLLLIHFIVPVVGMILFVWYYSFSPWNESDKLSAYIQILCVSFPVLIGIMTSILAESEQKSGGFQMLLSTATPKYIPHITKLIWLILFGFCSSLLALVGFGIGFSVLGYTTFKLLFYIKTAVLLSISVIPLYLLHYIISFLAGKGYSLGLGIIGSLLSALFLTGLGDGIWTFLPWGITARFSETLLVSNLMNIDFLKFNGIIQSMIFILILTSVFLIALIILSNKWEGRKSED